MRLCTGAAFLAIVSLTASFPVFDIHLLKELFIGLTPIVSIGLFKSKEIENVQEKTPCAMSLS
jgi:predicted solute-binding protein